MALRDNELLLIGDVAACPVYSHDCYGMRFERLELSVARKSGVCDQLPVICAAELLPPEVEPGQRMIIHGQVRAYNRQTEQGGRLMIAAFAHAVALTGAEPENQICLRGNLTRQPIYRSTPLGREIADLFVAVERGFGKSDYLPVIAWGRNARRCSGWQAGDKVEVLGRLQSRVYQKMLPDGSTAERTAFEVSATSITRELIPVSVF